MQRSSNHGWLAALKNGRGQELCRGWGLAHAPDRSNPQETGRRTIAAPVLRRTKTRLGFSTQIIQSIRN